MTRTISKIAPVERGTEHLLRRELEARKEVFAQIAAALSLSQVGRDKRGEGAGTERLRSSRDRWVFL